LDNNKINLRKIRWDDTGWIDLAQDRDQWKFLVNMVVNLGFYKTLGNEVTFELSASQEAFISMKLVVFTK
jgi:hypothetical protein